MGLKIDISGLRFRKSDGNLSRADQARNIQRRLSHDLNRSLLSKVRAGDDSSCESIFVALRKPEKIDVTEILPEASTSSVSCVSAKVIFPVMILIPGGTFIMGSEKEVIIPDFYCGKNMILKKEYMNFLIAKEMDIPKSLSNMKSDDEPAVDMSWADANVFCCEWLNKSGDNYRLLTSAEWEYVMRKQIALITPSPENLSEWTGDAIEGGNSKVVRCRSLIDAADGWLSVGLQGHAPKRGFRVTMDSPKT
jgi:formylglycine-generating enzyme required for sulfatase activity